MRAGYLSGALVVVQFTLAVVLLSGGLDSATALAVARWQGYSCHALTVSYGQRHEVEMAAATRVALTGTPIENGLGDLWAILDFTNPGLVGNRASFMAQMSGDGEAAMKALNGVLLFRRTKAEPEVAAELPDKIDELEEDEPEVPHNHRGGPAAMVWPAVGSWSTRSTRSALMLPTTAMLGAMPTT